MAHRYSVILCTLAGSGGNVWENPREVLETIANSGYDAVDLDAEPDRIPAKQFNEVRDLAFSLGLKVPALIGAWALWHAGEERDLASRDAKVRQRAVDYAKKSIELAATFDEPPCLEIVACPVRPEYPKTSVPYDVLWGHFKDTAAQIAEYAAQHNVDIAIEPINRFEAYAGFMNTIPEAVSMVREIGVDNLYVLFDFFHVNMEDGPVIEALRAAGDRLLHIHLADSNRQAPGTGHVDFLNVIRTLNAMNFTGYLSLDSVPARPDWKTLLQRTLPFMKNIEEMVALQDQMVGT